ncbi:MAG TPA: hypothetical protein ENN10_03825 [Actinobacteria bacterium]|nr:hypothetical protein [Actinomycetota bacterium]
MDAGRSSSGPSAQQGGEAVAPSDSVAAALRAYGEDLTARGAAQVGGAFTGSRAADDLIKHSPEAFLLGVLFTQGVPAERAWAGPYLLKERLGHLDLHRLAVERDAVSAAVAGPPALHRFVKTLPRWVSAAAQRLIEEYHRSAAAIWPDGTPLPEVVRRLQRFDGIGPKKAVMAAEILVRHFGIALSDTCSGSVAYDVHVRRVFLRAGLVAEDTPQAIREAAAQACPEAPGTLDLATWLIGRDYCRPTEPRCDACRLGSVCPRLVHRTVTGVGSRFISRD